MRKQSPTPAVAMISPPIPGPMIREALNRLELRATALGSSRRPTICTVNAWRDGVSRTITRPLSAASASTSHTTATWVRASTASAAAQTIDAAWVTTRVRRLSRRSEITPPRRPRTAKGPNWQAAMIPTAPAEWVSSSTSHDWATLCTQVPDTDTAWPMNQSR